MCSQADEMMYASRLWIGVSGSPYARLVLKTKDEALIGMTYRGIRYGPPDVVARIEKGEVVDPTSYYFRINPLSRPRTRTTTG